MTSSDLKVGGYYLVTIGSKYIPFDQQVMHIEGIINDKFHWEDYNSDGTTEDGTLGFDMMDDWMRKRLSILPLSKDKARTLISIWCDVQLD